MAASNIFSASAEEIRELFSDYLSGSPSCAVLALSESPLGDAARNAIERSLESFGYGSDCCAYATLLPPSDEPGSGVALDAQALFLLVEGLDPVCIVCADAQSARALGDAHRTAYQPDTAIRAFGRPGVAFRNLEELLASEAGKQKAWRLLKSLPRR